MHHAFEMLKFHQGLWQMRGEDRPFKCIVLTTFNIVKGLNVVCPQISQNLKKIFLIIFV
jgi:hypothetical protein